MKTVWIGFVLSTLVSASAVEAQFRQDGRRPPAGGPPVEAIEVCEDQQPGSACAFRAPHGAIEGLCRNVPEGLVCVPDGRGFGPPPGRPPAGARQPQADEPRRRVEPTVIEVESEQPPPSLPADKVLAARAKVPDTGQFGCFNNRQRVTCKDTQQRFRGQDGHYSARLAYRDNRDGTISDLVTGLRWQQAHNAQRLSYMDAQSACNRLELAGRRDWRLPSITELFSLSHWRQPEGRQHYIDERFFEFAEPGPEVLRNDPYRDTHNVSMMGQTWSSTEYVGEIALNPDTTHYFFFNFLDGRIKAAPGQGHTRLFYRCVSGEPWGDNLLQDNRNGTVTDAAMELMWQASDDGQPRDWSQALCYCEDLELAGYRDWRLPNIKELQTLVDYRYSEPAIDPKLFRQKDKAGWFWSSTTHGENPAMASYICFGPCTSVDGEDVHGAGAQRSDPKTGNPARWRARGGQRDETRIFNYARCVRDVD
ncbi:MAG: DUF1566 domain-containing protein [Candidatus Thiodiazotropha taylori]|nr:DUF1566 domain-containing protein [Candidatus Thiodiazotropha taylori]MCW4253425.1 DUF1566 domain-containing protein [Candidatus Thiodiazotropha taylori]